VLLFFFVAHQYGIIRGTVALVSSTILALALSIARDKRVPMFSIISSSFVLIFGIATIISSNPYWVVLEYTAYNGALGAVLIIGLLYGRALLKPLFETMFHISDQAWSTLSLRWAFAVIAVACVNEYVWRVYGTDVWIDYRLLAALFLCVFGVAQLFLTRAHRLPHASEWGLRK
jgi:intracellular septation protein